MELTIAEALQKGVHAHREGKIQDAESLYRAILQVMPEHPDANHNLGILAVSVGNVSGSLPLFKKAVESNPAIEQFWLSYIDALINADQSDVAVQVLAQARQAGVSSEKLVGFEGQIPPSSLRSKKIGRESGSLAAKRERVAQKKQQKKNLRKQALSSSPSQDQVRSLMGHYKAGRFQDAENVARFLTEQYPEHPLGWRGLGVMLREQGELELALDAFLQASRLAPEDAECHNNLGVTLRDLDRLEEAEACYRRAIRLKSDYAEALSNLGLVLLKRDRLEEAKESHLEAIRFKPSLAEAHNNLGLVFDALESFEKAEASYREAIRLKPDYAEAFSGLGATLFKLGQIGEAEESYREAIRLQPNLAEAYHNLSNLLLSVDDLAGAEHMSRGAILLEPAMWGAHTNLGVILEKLGRLEEAKESYREAIRLNADYAEAHYNLGNLLNTRENFKDAEQQYLEAIRCKPDHAQALCNLGSVMHALERYREAEARHREAIRLEPELAFAHNNLGNVLQELGHFEEAEASFREAIRIEPDYLTAYDNLLFMLNYDHRIDASELFREYEAYGEAVASLTKHRFDHADHPALDDRRLRLGYSSPDLRGHSCRFFMEPLFSSHDRDQFELFAYSNTRGEDKHTERLKGYFDHWIDVTQLTDEEMAQRIYDDQIDILVDMAGHTKGNRLPVFAMRPAPVQASSLIGYGYTTGLKEIDYCICDEHKVPIGSERYFSEAPLRLPAPASAYEPPREDTPDVSQLPALSNGYVTFGSLTRTVRLNDPLLRVWGEILARVPGSRLRLDQRPFASEGMRELFWQRLEGLGIPRERVELSYSTPHWFAYHDIDITLDCWPHNAGTTTLESLWMGVPVLSKMDRPSVGRMGAAVLRPLDLDDWLVETAEAYVERAVSFASDLESLARLRAELRGRVEQGPHLRAATVTQNLESAFRQMAKMEAR